MEITLEHIEQRSGEDIRRLKAQLRKMSASGLSQLVSMIPSTAKERNACAGMVALIGECLLERFKSGHNEALDSGSSEGVLLREIIALECLIFDGKDPYPRPFGLSMAVPGLAFDDAVDILAKEHLIGRGHRIKPWSVKATPAQKLRTQYLFRPTGARR